MVASNNEVFGNYVATFLDKSEQERDSLNSPFEASANYDYEVPNYEFLNVVTEDLTLLDGFNHVHNLKDLLDCSLHTDSTIAPLDKTVISDQELEKVIADFNCETSKTIIRNTEDLSYVELVDYSSCASCHFQVQDAQFYRLDHTDIDQLLRQHLEDNTHRG